ncbi:hypothetical protein AC578_3968 [Pseudocercospora eumusae]|uniref:Aminoglycoside phosphotransferase domain-containing protein n=1 Tax=Pseudocercospora eumusae TaxID=321146 RepID=A0A139HLV9_9PEZI|nr:hypothetical protein AC578_3968 [Pseudocercospora eumusae]
MKKPRNRQSMDTPAYLDVPRWKKLAIVLAVRAMRSKYLSSVTHRKGSVLMLSAHICVKSAFHTSLSEAHAMEFVRRNTSIPVPRVYYAFEHASRVYLVMQRIKAPNLSNQWVRRSEESKEKVLQQLKTMCEELRSLEVPKGIGVANVDCGPIYDQRLPGDSQWGPYSCIQDFHKALVDDLDIAAIRDESYSDLQELAKFYQQPWQDPVFTHGDLSSFNILCEQDEVVGIVDWETAGWLPPYWEYVTAWNVNPYNEFWQEEVDKFLTPDPFAREMDAVRRKYFGLF